MAMTINENPMNPVPLWTSKSQWQCNQKTFHDAMAWPVLSNGTLPTMALTLQGTPTSVTTVGMTVTQVSPQITTGTFSATISADLSNSDDITLVKEGASGGYPKIKFAPQGDGNYKITYYVNASMFAALTSIETGSQLISRQQLRRGGSYSYIGEATFNLGSVDLNYKYSAGNVTISVKRFDNDTQVTTKAVPFVIRGVVPYKTAERNGRMWIDADSVTGVADGVYYLQFTFDNVTYYSEPFMWLSNLGHFTHITHRRSDDIVTRNNVIIFDDGAGNSKQLSMYLHNIDQRPPYQFNPEVNDIDGRKFAEKQVSFYNRRIAFNCYEAFLEAIRLLWHCDIRYMGSRRIDYMEPPEMDWNTDNHLCDVVLEMSNYDDVIQTNGTASSYFDSSDSSHQSYDASFDASFD